MVLNNTLSRDRMLCRPGVKPVSTHGPRIKTVGDDVGGDRASDVRRPHLHGGIERPFQQIDDVLGR